MYDATRSSVARTYKLRKWGCVDWEKQYRHIKIEVEYLKLGYLDKDITLKDLIEWTKL